ncbi:hypothetical protein L873DRAFT_1821524 [Choiromyces venosus 120613-1]|uniref:Uncharacterized protein n=1 Tax=Choiromyces venosus 120613-1 TaxID=1336337 RepID=A0A3N4J8P4_9PEZI|nr:hypothetical protein L873DRAFT_1821524 [Choiromyces venosus 120613-1]
MVFGKKYKHPITSKFPKPEELEADPETKEKKVSADGASPLVSCEKMSKRKFNGTDPGECISLWGADATREHLLFLRNWCKRNCDGMRTEQSECTPGSTNSGDTPACSRRNLPSLVSQTLLPAP